MAWPTICWPWSRPGCTYYKTQFMWLVFPRALFGSNSSFLSILIPWKTTSVSLTVSEKTTGKYAYRSTFHEVFSIRGGKRKLCCLTKEPTNLFQPMRHSRSANVSHKKQQKTAQLCTDVRHKKPPGKLSSQSPIISPAKYRLSILGSFTQNMGNSDAGVGFPQWGNSIGQR